MTVPGIKKIQSLVFFYVKAKQRLICSFHKLLLFIQSTVARVQVSTVFTYGGGICNFYLIHSVTDYWDDLFPAFPSGRPYKTSETCQLYRLPIIARGTIDGSCAAYETLWPRSTNRGIGAVCKNCR